MYEDAFADGGFVKIIFSLPDSDADASASESGREKMPLEKMLMKIKKPKNSLHP